MPTKEREEPGLLDARRVERLLREGKIELLGLLPYSSNRTFLARVEADGAESLAVYKPAAGERPLWDFPESTLFRREAAAFELSRLLGWDLVPTTLVRQDGPLGAGSLQAFIEHDPNEHYFTLMEARPDVFRRLALFDYICNNADRKSGHCVLDRGGRVWAVDHGLTFHPEPKLRTVIWDFAGEPPASSDLRDAETLRKSLAGGSKKTAKMAELISAEEISALAARLAALGPAWVFPQPDSAWSFPWPLV